ncbi:PTS IIA-like nitrogen-regulatory protein PtsN [hydrothermal vent metagenome]|uniref:PTS IIA-like nitrogen-regulatory protein PtsN n=1 Tax=hydrothermal vent metagenome TaxID=652676 RepID=A0A3B0XU79_9ZZZZ
MNINQLIAPERVRCLSGISSKKRTLESLSHLLGSGATGIDPTEIFHQLIERERLGSTGLGRGVALPHARLSAHQEHHENNPDITSDASPEKNTPGDSKVTLGSFIKLDQGIDFDSTDRQPTDLLFGLLVPEEYTDEHLQVLAALATMFSDSRFCEQLRHCKTDDALYTQLTQWVQTHEKPS